MKSSEKRIKTLPLLIVSLSVIAVAVVTIILLLFTNGGDTAGSSGYILPAKPRFIYSKNKVLYMYDDGTAKCISELPAEDYTLTNDGNKLFFLSDNSLWCGNIENEEIKTEKIADEVAFYTVNSDGSKAMYSAKNGDVFVYSKGSEAKKIGTNCTTEYMSLYMSDNADKVMYITKNEQLKYCDGTNGKVIFVDYVNSYTIRCSENLSTVMYGKTDYTTDYPGQKVIVYSNFGENKEVFGECRIFSAYPEKNIMYYTDFRNDLYYYENGKSVKIRDNDNSGISASDEPVLVTSGGKGFLVTKKDKTEEIEFSVKASCVLITMREISADGNTLIFTASGDGNSKIYRLDLSDGSDKTPVAIDDDTNVTRITLTGDKKVVYSKTEYGSPMRNIYVDGKLISENADSDNITYLDGSFYYIKNTYGTDEEEPTSILTINQGGKETAVKDDVSHYCVLDKDNITMICGMKHKDGFHGGTLYIYKDGKIVKIDEEVTSIETAVKRYDKIDLDYYSMQ